MKTALFPKAAVLVAGILAAPGSVHACAVCMSGADETTGTALNGAIFLMLGVLGMTLMAICSVAFSIWRRSRQPLPAHAEFTDRHPGIQTA